jgi:hypothetical protein
MQTEQLPSLDPSQKTSFDLLIQDLDRICKKQKSTRKSINDTID